MRLAKAKARERQKTIDAAGEERNEDISNMQGDLSDIITSSLILLASSEALVFILVYYIPAAAAPTFFKKFRFGAI